MKKKIVTKVQRERHHSRWYWLWLFRAAILIIAALLINAWDTNLQAIAGIVLSGAGICWIYSWVHSQLEITCDKGDADCKDNHALGEKTAILKMGLKKMKKKPTRKA